MKRMNIAYIFMAVALLATRARISTEQSRGGRKAMPVPGSSVGAMWM